MNGGDTGLTFRKKIVLALIGKIDDEILAKLELLEIEPLEKRNVDLLDFQMLQISPAG